MLRVPTFQFSGHNCCSAAIFNTLWPAWRADCAVEIHGQCTLACCNVAWTSIECASTEGVAWATLNEERVNLPAQCTATRLLLKVLISRPQTFPKQSRTASRAQQDLCTLNRGWLFDLWSSSANAKSLQTPLIFVKS